MDQHTVVVAREPVAVTATYLESYIARHRKTVEHYDLLPEPRALGPALIRATRSPDMSSRIGDQEEAWFVECSESAPWSDVPSDASLVDADPVEPSGLYDAAVRLFDHFRDEATRGVAVAKVSKVLHLMRPALVPILDSRLLATYRASSAEVAERLGQQRPDLGRHRRMYWAAIREDLLASRGALSSMRSQLRTSDDPIVRAAADRVSDLRLLGMVTWLR